MTQNAVREVLEAAVFQLNQGCNNAIKHFARQKACISVGSKSSKSKMGS